MSRTDRLVQIELQRVHYMPKELQPGVLYVSEEFETAAHLCACGCGAKIRTPLGPTEWDFVETSSGPTLSPSIGNWQQPCQSHYLIQRGKIVWAGSMSRAEILAGRRMEETRRREYYASLYPEPKGMWDRFLRWCKRLGK